MTKPHPPKRYTTEQVKLVREMALAGTPYAEIQKAVPMPSSRISQIKTGQIRVKR